MENIVFDDIISKRTAYGLIWIGHYKKDICVIKMIQLTTGVHYDKNTGKYFKASTEIKDKYIDAYYNHNDNKPYYHMDFKHRRSMTPEAFFKEVDDLIYLSKLEIAPKVFGYGIDKTYPIHYGYIVMEKVDCSLKDIFLTRELHSNEKNIINELLNTMHDVHGIIHGDLKPSNVGVYLDKHKVIIKACLFDCQKIKHRENLKDDEFTHLAKRELKNFQKHIDMNRGERCSLTSSASSSALRKT